MLEALDITAEQAAGLDELAAMDLAMARHFAARAQAAEDDEVANQYGRSYQRMARSYRQTLALKARLQKDLRAAEDARRPSQDTAARIGQRKGLLRDKIRRTFFHSWEEAFDTEPEDHERLDETLEARLAFWAAKPEFLHEPIEFLEERIRTQMAPVLRAVFERRHEAAAAGERGSPGAFESSA